MKKRWIALLLAAVLPIGVLAGCGSEDMPELSLDSITAPVAARNEMEVRTALGNYTGISEAAPDSADGEMATVQFAGDASATTALHDGYIYVLSNSELRILRAAGASTTQLNTLDISSGTSSEDSYEFANALLVEGDRLAVVTTASSMDSDLSGSDVCHLRLYDISEPSTPTLLRTFSQDGLYEGIGTANGLLFLVSSGTADLDEASGSAASMPQIGDNAESEAVPAAQFYLSSVLDAPTFSIVSAISLADAQRSGVRAFTYSAPIPFGPPTLCAENDAASTSHSRTSRGIFPKAWVASTWKSAPWACAMAASSRTGSTLPSSEFAA